MRYYAAFFALLLIAFSSTASFACEDPPLPLRGMYLDSDVIVVGKIGKAGKWIAGTKEADSEYQIFNRAYPIAVEKVIKGDAGGQIAVNEENYHFLGEENGAKVPADDLEYSELGKDTGRRLFFLKKSEDGKVYTEIYHNRYNFAPKGKDMETYIARLAELNTMYKDGAQPAKETVLEWLVSMAENPVTRFEGAYELTQAFNSTRWEAENAEAEAAERKAAEEAKARGEVVAELPATEEVAEHAEGEGDHEEYVSYIDADFARLITPAQKERIVKAFMTLKFDYEMKKHADAGPDDEGYVETLNEGDRQLLDAALLTGDRRVAVRLMQEMPMLIKHEKYQASTYMEMIAGAMKDDRLKKLYEKYSEVAYGEDGEMIENKANAYDVEAFEGSEAERLAFLAKQPDKSFGARRAEIFEQFSATMARLTSKEAVSKK